MVRSARPPDEFGSMIDSEIEEYFTGGGGLIQRVEMNPSDPLIQQIRALLGGIVDTDPANA